MLKEFVASLTPAPTSQPVVRFVTGLGEQMQVDWAVMGRRPALGVRGDAGLEPGDLPRVRHRRAPRDADRRPQERLPGLRGRAARGVLRQHAHRGAGTERLRSRVPSLPDRLPGLRPPQPAGPGGAGARPRGGQPGGGALAVHGRQPAGTL